MHKRLYAAAFAVLIAGVAAGVAIYAVAEAPDEGADEILLSKQYTRDLRRYGGKLNVVFADVDRALASLWRGKRLGVTIAVLSIVVSAILFLAAWRLAAHERKPPESGPKDRAPPPP
jgi:hypothetical protein